MNIDINNVKKQLLNVNEEINQELLKVDYYDAERDILREIRKQNIQTILKIDEYQLKGIL